MSIYTNIASKNWDSLRGKLKPICCESCKADGCYEVDGGTCSKCLENQAYNRNYIETHTFVTDTYFESYHTSSHNNIKQAVLRKENENPYLFYGIELEVEFDRECLCINEDDYDCYDENEECNRAEYSIDEVLKRFSEITDGLFVYESDSSLENGIEFISRPCSYAFWTDEETVKKLNEGLEYLKSVGAYDVQPASNGMHVHISKKFFEHGNIEVANSVVAYQNFDWLFQKFQEEIEHLGGRKYTCYCKSKKSQVEDRIRRNMYDSNAYVEDLKISCKLKKGGTFGYDDHGVAVNSTNKTVEARVFKSTTDYKDVLANIELVRNFAHSARENNIDRTLNDILHTKDNLYLDEHIRKVRMECKRNKQDFDLEKVNTDTIEISVDNIH